MMKAQNMGPERAAGAQLGSGQRFCGRVGPHLPPGPLSSSGGRSGLLLAYLFQKTFRPCPFMSLKQIEAFPGGKNQKIESIILIFLPTLPL